MNLPKRLSSFGFEDRANRALRKYIVRKESKTHWQIEFENGPALIPIERSVVYLGTHLELGDCAGKHEAPWEAKRREAKIQIQAIGFAHRIRIWRACAVSATLGMGTIWHQRLCSHSLGQLVLLRAVTHSLAHITHQSNTT